MNSLMRFWMLGLTAVLGGLYFGMEITGATPAEGRAVVRHCQVLLIHDVDVPAQESGLLRELHVAEGDYVEVGVLLGQVDDTDAVFQRETAQIERDAAIVRAADDIEVRYAAKSFELAEVELSQSLEINRKSPGAVPASEIRRLQLARHRADLQIDRSELDLKVAQLTSRVQDSLVQAADESIRKRRIAAPFQGTVIEVFRHANEWVNAGEPVMRVVRLDELSVDGFLSGTEYDAASVAEAGVSVEVALPHGRYERFPGRIVFVNPLIQGGNKFRIRATVENRQENGHWILRPGMSATMIVH